MSAENMRSVLFRILTDNDFYNLVLVNPDEALKDYDLTDEEKEILATPDKNFYSALGGPGSTSLNISLTILPPPLHNPPPLFFTPPSVVVTSPLMKEDEERIVQLVKAIRDGVGQDRFAMIMELVQHTQGEQQTRSDPPQDE